MIYSSHPIVCFGEVLWDILPSGSKAGGAPMNVTFHLHKNKKNPCLITSIGKDEKGKELKKLYKSWKIHTNFFQENEEHETGKVYVHLDENETANYEIVYPVAWDFIEWNETLSNLVAQSEYFVYGTLASRNKVSKETLQKLLKVAKRKVIDINLRKPFYSFSQLEEMVSEANILKLNKEEFDFLTQNITHLSSFEDKIKYVSNHYTLEVILITNGSESSYLYENNKLYISTIHPVLVADTVGCGDAFLAGYLSKKLEGKDPKHCLEFANSMGAFIATQSGACPNYTLEQFEDFLNQ